METLAHRGTDAQLLMKPILDLGSDLCTLLSVKVWTHPVQACLMSDGIPITSLCQLCDQWGLICWTVFPVPLRPLFYQHIPLSFSGPLCPNPFFLTRQTFSM